MQAHTQARIHTSVSRANEDKNEGKKKTTFLLFRKAPTKENNPHDDTKFREEAEERE